MPRIIDEIENKIRAITARIKEISRQEAECSDEVNKYINSGDIDLSNAAAGASQVLLDYCSALAKKKAYLESELAAENQAAQIASVTIIPNDHMPTTRVWNGAI